MRLSNPDAKVEVSVDMNGFRYIEGDDGRPLLGWFSPNVKVEVDVEMLSITYNGAPDWDCSLRLYPPVEYTHNGKWRAEESRAILVQTRSDGRYVVWIEGAPYYCWHAISNQVNARQFKWGEVSDYWRAYYNAIRAGTVEALRAFTEAYHRMIPQASEILLLPDNFIMSSIDLERYAVG